MKRLLNICLYLVSGIIVLIAIIFCVIEGRLLFSMDWIAYEFAFSGCLRYICRLLLAIFALIVGLSPFINMKRKSIKVSSFMMTGVVALLVMSVIMIFFTTNFVGEVFTVIAVVNLLLNILVQNGISSKKQI